MHHLHHVFKPLLDWLAFHPQYGEIATFLITFSESIAIFGLIVPGSFLLAAIGGLIGSQVLPLWPTLLSATLGAIIGDTLSFSFGYYFSDNLSKFWPFSRYPHWLIKGRAFFEEHGGKSVFIGRFMGPLRPITPIIAGTLRMRYFDFIGAAIVSAWIWAPAYMLPGFLVGEASVAYPHQHFLRIFLVSLSLIFIAFLIGLGLRKACQYLAPHWRKVLARIWQSLLASPFKSFCYICQRHGALHQVGQLNLLLAICLTTVLFIGMSVSVYHHGFATQFNTLFFHFFQHHHTPGFDSAMTYISAAGKSTTWIIATLIVCASLFFIGEHRLSLHLFLLLLCAIGLGVGIKHLIHFHRPPLPKNQLLSLFSYPSGHTTLTATLIGFNLSLLWLYQQRFRFITIVFGSAWIILMALSRLYLGAHWLSDVIGGILLSLPLVGLCILSWRRGSVSLAITQRVWRFCSFYLMTYVITWQAYYFLH